MTATSRADGISKFQEPVVSFDRFHLLAAFQPQDLESESLVSKCEASKFKTGAFSVFDHDLLGLVLRRVRFSLPQVKCIMQQILLALEKIPETELPELRGKAASYLAGQLLLSSSGIVRLGNKLQLARSSQHTVFSLGIVLFELLSGEPYSAATYGVPTDSKALLHLLQKKLAK